MTEPKRIGDSLGASRSLPPEWNEWNFLDLVADSEMTYKKAPDVEWTCPECGKREMENEVLVAVSPHAICDECLVKLKRAEEGQSAEVVALQDKIDNAIPPIYQTTDPERLPWKQRDQVLAWKVPEDKTKAKGLWIVGDTRTGKTRTLCLLLKRLIREGQQVRTFFHGAFPDQLLEVIRSERSFRAWKREIARADILVIDDLFSFKMTERVESSIFEILDERIAYYRPTLVTTQLTGKDARERFQSLKRCEAFFARIEEFFVIVPTKQPKQDKMKL